MKPLRPTKRFPNMASKLGVITTPFGASTAQEKFHPGVDIANVKGTPIPTTTDGVVIGADYGHVKGENNWGNVVKIRDKNGNIHQYSHLGNGYVRPGDTVKRGQIIAPMSDTGATYSPSGGPSDNLDYRIVSAYGKYKSPLTYLKNL